MKENNEIIVLCLIFSLSACDNNNPSQPTLIKNQTNLANWKKMIYYNRIPLRK